MTELADATGVLLHLDSKFYYTLNQTGLFLWKVVSDGHVTTVEALAEAVARRFEVDDATAKQDTEAFLAGLRAEGLLVSR